MFQVGERVHCWDVYNLVGTVLESDQRTSVVDWGVHGIRTNYNTRLRRVGGLKKVSVTITINKPTWRDKPDSSRIENARPGIHAACYYTDDGSCWEWLITTKATGADIVKSGRSVDRRTAKSDAEFFIANYQPEDTSERDELRAKLEKSWYK